MTLELPADLEPYCESYDDLSNAGVYALELERPASIGDAWDAEFEERPPYWHDLVSADRCLYVGGTNDLLSRLEDHRDGEVRQTALTRVCSIKGLHTAWPHDGGVQEVFDVLEPRVARALQASMPDSFVHQR